MSGFGDNFDQPEVDPAAEFLAREQNELAGLEDEVKPAAISVPTLNGDDPTNSASSFEMVEGNDQEGLDVKKQPVDDFLFENDPYATDDFLDKSEDGVFYNEAPSFQEPRVEPEKIRKWREEQVKRLEEKDREEEKKKIELREIAKKELEEWYKNHEEAIEKTKAANRFGSKNNETVA